MEKYEVISRQEVLSLFVKGEDEKARSLVLDTFSIVAHGLSEDFQKNLNEKLEFVIVDIKGTWYLEARMKLPEE